MVRQIENGLYVFSEGARMGARGELSVTVFALE